ncbi:MAG TPA: lysophospholipid acyltransferase family protein [Pseudolabrys sp.]|nr:lysophospholipid acyltransferase family protein [Pseudolabrys sp.]
MIRALFIAVFFLTVTPLLISVQWLLGKFGLPGWGFICSNYYRALCRLLRIRVRVAGAPVRDRAVLYVSNHVSWADIVVIGSLSPVAFVAKKEVRSWPLVGITAEIQRTVFVDRNRRHQTADAVGEMVDRLRGGTSVVLFAEGTSSDGNRVLPFRSALLGAVKHVAAHSEAAGGIVIQPMAISYVSSHGVPLGRLQRPLVAWYGDLDFMPHIKDFISRGAIDVVVSYGEPVPIDAAIDRKELTRRLEEAVRGMMAAALHKRPLGAPADPAPQAAPAPLQQAAAS